MHTLTALSPLDGRYAKTLEPLRAIFSEYGLMYYRTVVEVQWLEHLTQQGLPELKPLSAAAKAFLNGLIKKFSLKDAEQIKQIEATTHHDVKAVEYYLKQQFTEHTELKAIGEWIHFGCTSEDINNLAYGLMLKTARDEVLVPALEALCQQLKQMAHIYAEQPMLARTHGQAATPTTLGKEFANMVDRLGQLGPVKKIPIVGKLNGAVGNFNAHYVACPELNWPAISQAFVEKLGLAYNAYTTQIEPHDSLAALCHAFFRCNTILINLCRDFWGYISLGYFIQKTEANHVGSSTMPHKVNPIDFENAEGNLGISNTLLAHFAEKLPISRWQRDLSDSTVLRNLGVAFGHALLAYQSCLKGLNKVEVNAELLNQELMSHWEVLGEAIQTVMRRYGIAEPYEKLKALTRGKAITQETLHTFIDSLALPQEVKQSLKQLTPLNYLGNATAMARSIP